MKTRPQTLLIWLLLWSAVEAQQPNIVHIIADDLGWADVEASITNQQLGSSFHQTPHLSRLAQQGLTFTNGYALQNCSPTRAAILTGQYGARTGVYNVNSIEGRGEPLLLPPTNLSSISPQVTTVAEMLQSAGYVTANVGKFDVTEQTDLITTDHGFDFNFGGTTSGTSGGYFPTQRGATWIYPGPVSPELDQFAEPYTQAYVDANIAPYANGNNVNGLVGSPKHLTDATTDAAISFLDSHARTAPVYLKLSYHTPHTPLESRPDLHSKYEQIITANGNLSPDVRHPDAAAAGLIEGLDQSVARLVSYLDAEGLSENTIVIFHGDNGPQTDGTASAPLRGRKGSLYEGGVRVPMFAWSPSTIQGGISDTPVHVVDLFPTFAELAGGQLPNSEFQPLDGESFVPLLNQQGAQLERDGIFTHYPGYQNNNDVRPLSSIVTDMGPERYKLMRTYDDRAYELYNLNADLSEADDLVASGLSVFDYKVGTLAAESLRNWLVKTNADLPTIAETQTSVPLPASGLIVHFALGADSIDEVTQQASAELTEFGINLSIQATGDDALFSSQPDGLGILSGNEADANFAGIDGSLPSPEAINLTFDTDVELAALDLESLAFGNGVAVYLEAVGDINPFASLSGYDRDGFSLDGERLLFEGVARNGNLQIEFGSLLRDPLMIAAGTTLSLTTTSAGGVLLQSLDVARPLSATTAILVDFNLDGQIDVGDIDALVTLVSGNSYDPTADLNRDKVLDMADVQFWLDEAADLNGLSSPFSVGDTNLDGTFDSSDLVNVFATGHYDDGVDQNSTWSSGDWNGDGEFDSSDLVAAFQPGAYVRGSVSPVAIPEPSTRVQLVLSLTIMCLLRERSSESSKRKVSNIVPPGKQQQREMEYS